MRWSFDILCKHVKYGWPAVTEKKNLQNKSEIMKKKNKLIEHENEVKDRRHVEGFTKLHKFNTAYIRN
jgi:hypothetical protein